MSKTLRQLGFSVIVSDVDHWSEENRKKAEEDDSSHYSYDDWAIEPLIKVMYEAGQKYVSEHPDLFDGEIV